MSKKQLIHNLKSKRPFWASFLLESVVVWHGSSSISIDKTSTQCFFKELLQVYFWNDTPRWDTCRYCDFHSNQQIVRESFFGRLHLFLKLYWMKERVNKLSRPPTTATWSTKFIGWLVMQLSCSDLYSNVLHGTSSPADKISGRLWRRIKNRRRQIRWYNLNTNESTTLLTFTIWNITMLKNGPFLSNRRFKKGCFLKKVRFYFFIKRFLHTFCQKQTFCYPTAFIESLITHKRFVFEESYISYGKRQKSCTFIVV